MAEWEGGKALFLLMGCWNRLVTVASSIDLLIGGVLMTPRVPNENRKKESVAAREGITKKEWTVKKACCISHTANKGFAG
jgi:hypothetical protein